MMTDPCTTILKEYLNGIKQVGSFHNIGISAWKINGFPFSGDGDNQMNVWYVVTAMAPQTTTTYARVTIIDPVGTAFAYDMDTIPDKLKKLTTYRAVELYLDELDTMLSCSPAAIGKFQTPINLNEVACSGILHYYKNAKPMVNLSEFKALSTPLDLLMTQLVDLVTAIVLKSLVDLFSTHVDGELDTLCVLNN